MIIDTLAGAAKYFDLHKNFKVAFDYINATDLTALAIGKYDIADGLKLIVSDGEGKTAETAAEKFECHNKNIDIQFCVRGNETIGWKPRTDCKSPKGEYSDEKDVLFFSDTPDTYFALKNNQFVIFYPEDVHAPMIGNGLIKKLVFKVKI